MRRRIVATAIQFLRGDKRRSRIRVCIIRALLLLLLLALKLVDSRKFFSSSAAGAGSAFVQDSNLGSEKRMR
jgi:hypothetical protein